ncbi:MAG: PASTA domain-containing protein [Candidatus Eisenbacteria bacterium]|uniref:PASTA domain-containing protein n=1 Tax=Eiseniibacteriota bacterium TaxID=2212470 RepID=A0A938BPZ6_UNCEI|nr:PASTA domain-containing protein [Candidatus Eisenbacteria bacterium]
MSAASDGRLRVVLGLAALLFAALLLRAGYLALGRHAALKAEAEDQQTQVEPIPPPRGPIVDRAGRTLVCSMENPSLVWAGASCPELVAAAEELARAGLCAPEQPARLAASRSTYHYLTRRWVPESFARDFVARHPGVRLEPEMKRFYPSGASAPQALGLVGIDGAGLSGLECQFDDWLSGEPGRVLRFVTGSGRPQQTLAPRVLREPRPGGGLLLSLDARVQEVVRYRLTEGMAEFGAAEGFALVLDPRSGEILSLWGEPSFDPQDPGRIDPDLLRVRCVTDQFEPGSTFKINTFSAALESGLVSPSDLVDCGNGRRRVPGGEVRDVKKMGVVTAAEALVFSSNIGNGIVAERTGWQRFYRMAQAFGFGQPTGIPLGGEAAGSLPHPLQPGWSERSLLTIAYGQEVSVTGLQMALAYAAVANDGWLMKPLLVRARLDPQGRVLETFQPEAVRRVLSAETAVTMRGLLRRVVCEGTGKEAEAASFAPAGKTGTAQIYDPALGRYLGNKHIVSFIGFAPWDDPHCVVAVTVWAEGDLSAGKVAAPIFRRIVEDLAWWLEDGRASSMPMAECIEAPIVVPDVRGFGVQAAREALHAAGLIPVLEGLGGRVEELAPQPYASVPRGSVVRLALADRDRDRAVRVPNLAGLSLRRAVSLAAQAGLAPGVRGSGWVVEQAPAAGSEVPSGTLCEIWASPRASRAREEALRRNEFGGPAAGLAACAAR